VGLYFAVIHKATISHFTVTKTIRMTFANPFYKRTKQGRVENKPSPLWAGLLAMHPHGLPKYCAALGAVFNTAVSEVLQRIYQKKKKHILRLSDETVCRLLPVVYTYEQDEQFVIC